MKTSTITLNGKTYPLSWGNLAKVRYTGVPTAVRSMGGVVDLAVMVWACIAVKPNPFDTWEHVAEIIKPEDVLAISDAISSLFEEDTAEKKSIEPSGLSPSSDSV